VLAKQSDANSTKHGRDEITQLCNRTPAITDLDTIYQIQIALKDLGIGDDGGKKLWERAAAARPEDKDIAMTWLDEAIDRCDWQSAQKV
jgi:N-terminal acetyltransferase B complex non-catalytic subunit